MLAQKWIPSLKIYVDYVLPEGATTFETDMSKEITCASCGEILPFGETFTSRQIHTTFGFGFSVCDECYQSEWGQENDAKKKSEQEDIDDK